MTDVSNFHDILPNSVDLKYIDANLEPFLRDYDSEGDVELGAFVLTPERTQPTNELELGTPSWVRVKSAQIKFAPDGSQVVDLILEVEDVRGAESYEVRISKE